MDCNTHVKAAYCKCLAFFYVGIALLPSSKLPVYAKLSTRAGGKKLQGTPEHVVLVIPNLFAGLSGEHLTASSLKIFFLV